MKKQRKKVIAIFAACMFAMMMSLNVSTTVNGTNFSVDGYTALVSGSTGSTGTCCQQLTSECIVGSVVRSNRYYKSEGPC